MDTKLLLGSLNSLGAHEFRLHMLELVGMLVLMQHWQRGIIDMLVQTNKTKEMTEAERENWDRVIKNIETYEAFAWEIAPARALIPVLRHYRLTGELPEGFERFNDKDELGRIPYGSNNLDYIENILRRVADCRTFERNNGKSNIAE